MPDTKPRAIIVGGSLGGLFAATTMLKIGWDVEVYERSPHTLDSRGGGIVLQPDVLAALSFGGVNHSDTLGVPSFDRIYLERDDRVIQRSSMPQTQTSWSMVYSAMRRHLPQDLVRPGHQFVRFEQEGKSVHVFFENGHEARGDLLIAADGARSTVREQVMPGVRPTYAGYVAWRGLVPELELPQAAASVLARTFAFQQGPRHLMLEYLVPGEDESVRIGERRWNWVWYLPVSPGEPLQSLLTDRSGVSHAFSLPPGSPKESDIAAMRQKSSELLAPTFQSLVGVTQEPFVQAILDLQVNQMVFGRVVLTGDSAFVPRPHTAGSTAKAAANAVALAYALDGVSSGNLDAALADWQKSQLLAGASMTRWGIAMGDRIMGL
ncbi:FAD binding domain-containing protein [Paraburkholderia sp. J7]|uniref:FAD binding domain-containing protein n=1 Tax=Paraburkholderia sp. J7 TaxID=2805438 RepID=UPI002AB72C1D|nr:FAD binding domain-containing protein [Paraburkholderia sp. J7]